MSLSERRASLIAYDITEPRRLCRVHHFLKQHAIPVQYSVFAGLLTGRNLQAVVAGLARLIDRATDDVRIYPLPSRCEAVALGRQILPEGVLLADSQLLRFLPQALGVVTLSYDAVWESGADRSRRSQPS